ncbi:MAG: chemotaxis protein CheX [Pseudobutyrivibrio sp.]|nr:chemotaxis protein CheX [Pseudobutyrivibrio sp.]
MYSQFFGSYLLRRGAITPEQLTHAISQSSAAHIKLGTLAIHKGYMVASEVEEVCYLQTREDRRFGEIAIDRGYLTEEQVRDLLKTQTPNFLLFGQCLVDDGAITYSELQTLILDYEAENELCEIDIDLDLENQEKISHLIERFFLVAEIPVNAYSTMYMELLFNNLVRFIGDDFTPLTPISCTEYPVNYCISQNIHGKTSCSSRIDMEQDVAIAFASRFAKMEFTAFDEYVQASIEDFINLHNGLFLVNMSNNHAIELSLDPPSVSDEETLALSPNSFVLPIIYPFGAIHFIISLHNNL